VAEAGDCYRVSRGALVFRALFRPVFRGLFRLLSRVHLIGLQNVPERGPYLIAVNHVSLFEPPLVIAFWPVGPEAVGAADIWERPGQASLARLYGGIPVRRGEYDRRLLDTMLKVLESGRPLLIAPEGGRSHHLGMRRALPGVAYVVDKARVPVVPVGVAGTADDFLVRALRGERPPLWMHVGPALRFEQVSARGEARRVALQQNADLVMTRIAALLPPEYHGFYARQGNVISETS
jgi:1-acyl-sn-glycerol-3-phosphate acyltransferase